jgi:hypothetical protein
VAVTPYILTQKIETVFYVRACGFLVGESETPLGQEVFHERLDFLTQKRRRRARDKEVIRIANQVDAVPFTLRAVDAEALGQQRLQSIQGSIRQSGRSNPALRGSFRGGEEDVLVQVARFQPR